MLGHVFGHMQTCKYVTCCIHYTCVRAVRRSTVLWEALSTAVMDQALGMHHDVLRGVLSQVGTLQMRKTCLGSTS